MDKWILSSLQVGVLTGWSNAQCDLTWTHLYLLTDPDCLRARGDGCIPAVYRDAPVGAVHHTAVELVSAIEQEPPQGTVYLKLTACINALTCLAFLYSQGVHGNQADCAHALATTYTVLYTLCRLMAPFTPYLVEYMYLNLRKALPVDQRQDSVHYLLIPEVNKGAINPKIEQVYALVQCLLVCSGASCVVVLLA